jgi:hypothetical protein
MEDVMDDQVSVHFPGREQVSNDGWPRDRVVMATLEEVRYAEMLRLQIRSAHERKAPPPPWFWSVGVD